MYVWKPALVLRSRSQHHHIDLIRGSISTAARKSSLTVVVRTRVPAGDIGQQLRIDEPTDATAHGPGRGLFHGADIIKNG
jgi:hypothetical protein